MLRIVVAVAALGAAVVLIVVAAKGDSSSTSGALSLNLGTELLGIVVTVAIIERLFEWRTTRDEGQRMAWRALHELDHAVWVWQGGRRAFDIDELAGLLRAVDDDDDLPPFTQNLLIRLGSKASDTLRHNPEVAASDERLKEALESIAVLAAIRDSSVPMSPRQLADPMAKAVRLLAEMAGLRIDAEAMLLEELRDPSPAAQRWRHFGETIGDPARAG